MNAGAVIREAYQEYLEGKRSLDEVLELAERMRESIRASLPRTPEPTPEEIEAEEAEWARMRARSRAAPLWKAYQRYLDGECSLDDVPISPTGCAPSGPIRLPTDEETQSVSN